MKKPLDPTADKNFLLRVRPDGGIFDNGVRAVSRKFEIIFEQQGGQDKLDFIAHEESAGAPTRHQPSGTKQKKE